MTLQKQPTARAYAIACHDTDADNYYQPVVFGPEDLDWLGEDEEVVVEYRRRKRKRDDAFETWLLPVQETVTI
jgi:hypothetical protein